jgi:hypothetical protein
MSEALGATQDGANARHQLTGRAGLGHVVVGTHVEADDAVDVVAARGEHQHRHLAACANAPQRLDAGQARHHDVEHHDRVAAAQGLAGAGLAVVLGAHVEAFAHEVLRQHRGEVGVVVDEQNLGHWRAVSRRSPAGGAFPPWFYPA